MRIISYAIMSGGLLLGLTHCSKNNSQPSTQGVICVPGATRVCVGPGDCQGAQACGADGRTWSDCNCGSDAAVSGTGGAAGHPQDAASTTNYVLIDDMEGTDLPNGPIKLNLGVTNLSPGYWFDLDSTGNASDTMSPNPFSYSALPSPHDTMNGIISRHAAHLTCLIADAYGYCEESFWLAQIPTDGGPADAFSFYNVSAHSGIVFWGMSNVSNSVKVAISDIDTAQAGGKCGQGDASADQCWDDFCTYVTLTNTWQRFEVKFADLMQQGWGYAAPSGKFDPTTAAIINFAVDAPASATAAPVTADFWIDDIYFE